MYTVLNRAEAIKRPVASRDREVCLLSWIPTMVFFNISSLSTQGLLCPYEHLHLVQHLIVSSRITSIFTRIQKVAVFYSFIFSLLQLTPTTSLSAIVLKFCYNSKHKKNFFFALNCCPVPLILDNEEFVKPCKSNSPCNHLLTSVSW